MLLSNGAKKYFPLFFSVYYIARENINIFTGYVVGRENINIFTGSVIEYNLAEKDISVVRPGIELGSPGREAGTLPLSYRCYDDKVWKPAFIYLIKV